MQGPPTSDGHTTVSFKPLYPSGPQQSYLHPACGRHCGPGGLPSVYQIQPRLATGSGVCYTLGMADEIKWAKRVDVKHLKAAESYLALKYTPQVAAGLVQQFQRAKLETKHAGDILRASKLKPLRGKDPGVKDEAKKVEDGESLTPVLIISYPIGADIADGYHRVSHVYRKDGPFGEVSCKVIHPLDLYA